MPPKQAKKKKKSKKQIELELERQREEARLAEKSELERKEAEELKRREDEKHKKEVLEIELAEEQKRIEEQHEDDVVFNLARENAIADLMKENFEAVEWNEYLKCSDLPNPRKESDLNSYYSLWCEDNTEDSNGILSFSIDNDEKKNSLGRGDVENVLKRCAEAENVLEGVGQTLADATEMADNTKVKDCLNYMKKFRDITFQKMDQLTANVLNYYDEHEKVIDSNVKTSQPNDMEAKTDDMEAKKEILEFCETKHIKYGLWAHTSIDYFRRKSISFGDLGIVVDLPKSVAMLKQSLAVRVIYTTFDHFSGASNSGFYVPIGGVLQIQQLSLPKAPKKVKGWTMRETSEDEKSISILNMPTVNINAAQPQPFRISCTLSQIIFLPKGEDSKNTVVGWWNEKEKEWKTEGISEIKYDNNERVLSFATVNLSPFAIIQPRALDFPYREWSFVPFSNDRALFTVYGSRFEVCIEVMGSVCRLKKPTIKTLNFTQEEKSQFHNPGSLLWKLRLAGVNLMPADKDAQFCRKPIRSQIMEKRVHEALSIIVPVFAIRGSKFNHSREPDRCMFQIKRLPNEVWEFEGDINETERKESIKKTSDDENDWLTIVGDEKKFKIVETRENYCSEKPVAGQVSHSSLQRALFAYYQHETQQALESVEAIDLPQTLQRQASFNVAARSLFNLLRVLTFY